MKYLAQSGVHKSLNKCKFLSSSTSLKIFFFAFSSWSVNSLSTESKPYFSVHDVQERGVIKTELGRKGRRERGRQCGD